MSGRKLQNILVTGGAGFIGSNFIHYLFGKSSSKTNLFNDCNFNGNVINLDNLTYAGNLDNLKDIEQSFGGSRYFFEKADICNKSQIQQIFKKYNIDTVVHFAAESHVDRSISGPESFIKTNVMGTFNLLEVAKSHWIKEDGSFSQDFLFHHISTDEVYGSLADSQGASFSETTPYAPRSPYSASKASSDHLVMSYFHTYGLPVTISNCSNNYGPYQYPEKLIPVIINSIKNQNNIPVYGNGKNIRDWIYVEDHNRAVWQILNKGTTGEKYNIGGENQWENIKLVKKIIELSSKALNISVSKSEKLIKYVQDRPGHDFRYSINCDKIKNQLGWKRLMSFEEGLQETVNWYLSQNNGE